MPKYMFQASYTHEGLRGLLKDGGTKRREAVEKLAETIGGKLESVYFAFGDADVYVIMDIPDNVTATRAALTVGASGAVTVKTVVLLTAEEVDQATQQSASYTPPGE